MTYQILYIPNGSNQRYALFDIEFYLDKHEDEKWSTEVRCLTRIEGVARYLRYKFNDKLYDFEDFIEDACEIQEIRGVVMESSENVPSPYEIAAVFFRKFQSKLLRMLREFCITYNLELNID